MPIGIRRAVQGHLTQGVDEEVIYKLTTTSWGSDPTAVVVAAHLINDGYRDVSDVVLSGSPGVSGDVITLPTVKNLAMNSRYRIEVKFTVGGNVLEAHFIVDGEM